MAGTDLYWGHGEDALRELAEAAGIPVFLNGLARGCLRRRPPAASSRARAARGSKGADVALVIGVPMDFRLGFGQSFGEDCELIALDVAEPEREHPRAGRRRALRRPAPGRCARSPAPRRAATRRAPGPSSCAASRTRSAPASASSSPTRARRCTRCASTPSSAQVLDRDAIVICDGGDFASYAGRAIDSYEPGCWLDPGPVRLPRLRPGLRARGQARAARPPGRAAARRRRVRLLRDGVGHARAPRRRRRRRDRQQRHLGPREAPDGVPLRLLGRRRPAAGDALRHASSRRSAATARWCASPAELQAGARARARAPTGRRS